MNTGLEPPRARPESQLVPAKIDVAPSTWAEHLERARKRLSQDARSPAAGATFACVAGVACAAGLLSLLWPKPNPIEARAVPEPSPQTQAARAVLFPDPLAEPAPDPQPAWWRLRLAPRLEPRVQARASPFPARAQREPRPRPHTSLQSAPDRAFEQVPYLASIVTPGTKKKGFLRMRITPNKAVILGAILAMGRLPGNSPALGVGGTPGGGPVPRPGVVPGLEPPPAQRPAVQPSTEGPKDHAVEPALAQGPSREPFDPARGREGGGSASPENFGSDDFSAPPAPPGGVSDSPSSSGNGGGSKNLSPRIIVSKPVPKFVPPPLPSPQPQSLLEELAPMVPVPFCQMRPQGFEFPGLNFDPKLPFCEDMTPTTASGVATVYGDNGSAACQSGGEAGSAPGTADGGTGNSGGNAGPGGDGDGGSGDGGSGD